MKDRLLVVGGPNSGKLTLVESVFGSLPLNVPKGEPHSGLIHRVELVTKYFATGIDLWIDETNDFEKWCEMFTSEEAKEAREVIHGIVFCFKFKDGLKVIQNRIDCLVKLIEKFEDDSDGEWDGLLLAVGHGEGSDDLKLECEDLFMIQGGFEMVSFNDVGKNEFGEVMGKERIRQVIECHDWEIQEFKDEPVVTTSDDKDTTMVNLLDEDEIDLNKILEKLHIAKDEISKLGSEAEKHEYAQKVMADLGI